jgi:hypothetical protein
LLFVKLVKESTKEIECNPKRTLIIYNFHFSMVAKDVSGNQYGTKCANV